MILVLSLAALLPDAARATAGSRATSAAPAATRASSAAAAEAVRRFENAIAGERAAFQTLPVAGGIGPNLAARVALEQAMRRAIGPAVAGLREADRIAASTTIWRRIGAVDGANTTYVKSVLPPDGWFRSRRDGAEVARHAWLIVQHSPDEAFQRTVTARMRPLVASGDARGADYALLYDRTEMAAGRPQLYGSQMTCSGGRWQTATTAEPAGVDRRRADMGLRPVAEYLKKFEGGC